MYSKRHILYALQLGLLAPIVVSQSPFDAAETTIITSTSTCYSLPVQTDTATKAPFNETINSDIINNLNFYFDESGLTSVFGLHDIQNEVDLIFDITDPLQLGIVYPDHSAVIFNGSGITVFTSDCSSVLSLVLPGFHDYLLEQGGSGGGTKKSKRQLFPAVPFFPKEYFIDMVIYDQCGHVPDDPFAVILAVGGGYECADRASVINGVWQQGVNGLYKWKCLWPSPTSKEQYCELDLLRRLGYLRETLGTLVDVPSLVRIFSQGVSNMPPFEPGSAAAEIMNSPYFSPTWSSTMTGLNTLMELFQQIQSQQLDPNVVAAQVCLPHTNLKEYVSLKFRDDPSYTYILTSVGVDNEPFVTSMQFNEEIIASVTSSCVFSGPSTLPLTTPINTNILIGCGDGTNTATATDTAGIPARFRKRATGSSPAVCTATRSSTSTTTPPPTLTTSSSSSTSWKLSLTTFVNPPQPSVTCSLDTRCDPAPSAACEVGNSELPPGTPWCFCGNNVEGTRRCFKQYVPTVEPVYCRTRGDCPGGMECKHEFPCWYVGGWPGMCYDTCGPF